MTGLQWLQRAVISDTVLCNFMASVAGCGKRAGQFVSWSGYGCWGWYRLAMLGGGPFLVGWKWGGWSGDWVLVNSVRGGYIGFTSAVRGGLGFCGGQ